MKAGIVLYCEDPGAANFMVGLPARLRRSGLAARLFATEAAAEFLVRRGETAEALTPDVLEGAGLLAVGTSENPDSPGLPLIAEARRRGIPSVGIVDSDVNARFRFRGRGDHPLAFAPDWLAVPDGTTAAAYRDLGFPAARLGLCGYPHFDRAAVARRRLDEKGRAAVRAEMLPAAGTRPIVVFLAEQPFSLDPGTPVDAEPSAFPGDKRRRVEAVLDVVLGTTEGMASRPFIALRLHPKNSRGEFADFEQRLDLVSAGGDPLPLLYCADVVVGLTTTLLAEAAILGRPVLPVAARAEDKAWMPGLFREGWPLAESAADIRRLVPALLDGTLSTLGLAEEFASPESSIGRLAAFLNIVIHA